DSPRESAALRHDRDREDDDVCARPRPRAARHAGHPESRPRGSAWRLPAGRAGRRHCQEFAVSDATVRRGRPRENRGDYREGAGRGARRRWRSAMSVTKTALPRRTVLRGLGATLSLPLLDAMVPALTAEADTPARAIRRFGVFYIPNGVILGDFVPKTVG